MAFCIVMGTTDLRGRVEGYDNVVGQCYNCHNWSARVESEFPMFTICWIPLIPMATHKYKLLVCPICHYKQDLSARQDIQDQKGGGGRPPGPPQGYPQQGPPQGYQQQHHGPPQGYQQQHQQQGGYYGPQK